MAVAPAFRREATSSNLYRATAVSRSAPRVGLSAMFNTNNIGFWERNMTPRISFFSSAQRLLLLQLFLAAPQQGILFFEIRRTHLLQILLQALQAFLHLGKVRE